MKLQGDDKRIIRLTEDGVVLSLFSTPDCFLTIGDINYKLDYICGAKGGKPFICRYKLRKDGDKPMKVCLGNRAYDIVKTNPIFDPKKGGMELTVEGSFPHTSISKSDMILWSSEMECRFFGCSVVEATSNTETTKLVIIYDHWTQHYTS